MAFFISLEIEFGRGPIQQKGESQEATHLVAARKGWRTKIRKLWGRLKTPRIRPEEEKIQSLTSRITELEKRLAEQSAASQKQFLALQSQLGNVLSVLLNGEGSASSTREDDGPALEEGEEPDAVEIPAPLIDNPSQTAVSSEWDGTESCWTQQTEEVMPSPAQVQYDVGVFDLNRLPARYHCCPPGFCPFDRVVAAAEAVIRPQVSWSSLRTYQTTDSEVPEPPDSYPSGPSRAGVPVSVSSSVPGFSTRYHTPRAVRRHNRFFHSI
ncbi:hypothetical protein DRE_00710 [Drechslerella stenobrocha 248]|uniref:Uncharacterized protein n=1 Tax=Drechslerella stenobrocha 248 TaxID=1043628 RepID=W7HMS3_9PEZI|nr:hypothetical protein DRE_00710 [Drechslerella stenobrocha 248]